MQNNKGQHVGTKELSRRGLRHMDTQTKVNRQGLGAAGRGKAKERVFPLLSLPSVLRGARSQSCDIEGSTVLSP